ncbi:MAG TPA: hypothetical protein VF111_05240 [Thermoanaerobaculia bacterium]
MNEIEDVLREEREIEPSPFFARRVMAMIRAETQFAPLPFPWKRIASAIVLLLVAIAAGLDAPEATLRAESAIAVVIVLVSIVTAAMTVSLLRRAR